MDKQDQRILKILEVIDSEYAPSQRDLAKKLNISLGLANSFVKRLAHKGFFKITNIPSNRVRYILTPEGAAEKTRLTYEYIRYSFEFYKISRQKIRGFFQLLTEQQVAQVIFYGISDLAEIAYISLQEFPLELVAIMDDEKSGEIFLGKEVANTSVLNTLVYDKILLTVTEPPEKAVDSILMKGVAPDKIAMLH